MAATSLTELIQSLTPEQQEAVRQFVSFLKQKPPDSVPFLDAVDEFMREHPDLMRRLGRS